MGLFSRSKKKSTVPSGDDWKVEIKDGQIISTDTDGQVNSLDLSSINKIIIETNDSGPWETDLWWKIIGLDEELKIPGGASGEDIMLPTFQKFENFNNAAFIDSMSSVGNAEFICWEKIE